MKIQTLNDRPCPPKSWGFEEWIINNELYCGKRLHFTVLNGATSLHYHQIKHETMYVERGIFEITIVDYIHTLEPGNSIVIPPGTVHRIRCLSTPSILIEFSTTHRDEDSYRITK